MYLLRIELVYWLVNQAIRVRDGKNHSALAVSACGLQMAMVHPKGRYINRLFIAKNTHS